MINQIDPLNQFTWWSSLKHGGLLIAPARLAHHFSDPETGACPSTGPVASAVLSRRSRTPRSWARKRHYSIRSWKASCNFRRWSGRRQAPLVRSGAIASSRARTSNRADSGWEATALFCRFSTTT